MDNEALILFIFIMFSFYVFYNLCRPVIQLQTIARLNIFQVSFLGDGSLEQRAVLSEFQLYDFDYLTHVGTIAPMPGLIRDTRLNLTKAVQE